MDEHYQAIGRELDISPSAVHLVHYVLREMKSRCVLPPDLSRDKEFYTASTVCGAVLAYIRCTYPKAFWRTLAKFEIESSSDVGRIAKALQANHATKVVRRWKVSKRDYADLFSVEEKRIHAPPIRWQEELESNAFPARDTANDLLKRHFRGVPLDSLVISSRQFPEHMRADLQLALNDVFENYESNLVGLNPSQIHDGLSFRKLALAQDDSRMATGVGPLTYSDIHIGNGETISCQSNGLWLAQTRDFPFAVVLGSTPHYSRTPQAQIEIAVQDDPRQQEAAAQFLESLQKRVESSACYRGKILSFEISTDYHGRSSGLMVHDLKRVTREQVILPQRTLDLLDRNIIDFVRQRPALAQRGLNLKKGLLLFGPPGTGKTHTVHYLSQALPETTSLIVTSEQVAYLSEYMTLARLLQPSLVIIEDADLIARQREEMEVCEEVLLNKLLNEMDGLRADAEIIFLLTTNRPEALEAALTARPGRIDQAIEYPLPDAEGRLQLAKLYAGTQQVPEDVLDMVVNRTEHLSAAFIKELMRRATQYAIDRGVEEPLATEDVETAVDELLFSGGVFNRRILGAGDDST